MIEAVAIVVAGVVLLALSLVARDSFVRLLADRADARVKRTTETEKVAHEALAEARAQTKKIRDVEVKVATALAKRVRG